MVWICIDSFYLETETFVACHCLEKPHLTYLSLCLLIHRSESTVLNVRLQLVKGKWALMLTHQVSIYGWIWYATRRMLVTSQLLFPIDLNRFVTIQFHLIAKKPFSTRETKTFHKDGQLNSKSFSINSSVYLSYEHLIESLQSRTPSNIKPNKIESNWFVIARIYGCGRLLATTNKTQTKTNMHVHL